MAYDDQRYFTQQVINLGNEDKAQTSVIAANTEHERFTAMCNITVKDFNVFVVDGHTTTGAAATTAFKICLAKSAAGTGTDQIVGLVVPRQSAPAGGADQQLENARD